VDWQNLYVKREVDQRLMKLWEDAKSGKPQFAVLLAETGWGKTRAIQHFYEQLRQEEDLHGYYPETLTDERDSATPRRSAVNPNLRQSEATVDQIPYLWWGIRFSCDAHAGGISAYRDALAPHLLAVALKQRMSGMSEEEKRAWRELGAELVSEGVETVVEIAFGPILLLIKTAARVENIRRHWNKRRQLRAAPQPTLANASQQARESLADQITAAFRAILNPTEKRYPTVPVVIAMDDAQWADPDSLEVIRKIWELAVANGWQLLIIATHWMGDYRRYQNRDREADKTLRLPDLHRPDRYQYIWHEIDLSENADLRAITRAAFPRMHESQVQEFTNITQGHPLYLRELILEAKKHPSWFVNRDTDGNLTTAGLRLSQQFRGLHELARSRFDSQPEPVRTILAWGSRQGMQFLHRLTRAHAEDQSFQPCYNRTEHDEAIRQAREDAILDALPEVEGSEFDQIAYQKAAEEYLNNEPDRVKRAFKRSLCNTLKAYIQNGLAGVPPAEQTLLLSIAAKELRPRGAPRVDEPNWQVWARAVYMLFQRLRQELHWIQAEAVALQLVPKNLPAEGWSFDALDFWEQYDLFLFLRMFSELQAAGRLANALRLRTEPTAKASRAQAEALKRYAVALVCVGDVHRAQLQWQDALACYQESLQVCRQIVAEFGKTPKSLRDLSVSLERVGNVWAAQRQWQDALACYQESLQVRRQIVAEFGETPASLRDLSVALDRVGDVHRAQLQWQDALACYQESLQVCRQIVDEFGETPESLRDLSVALDRVGDVWAAQLQWQDALACYQESLQVRRQIVAEFGKTPESLRDLSVSLNKVGDVWAAQLQWQDALACYQESLQVRRQIVAEFGKTPASLRDLSVALDRVGDVWAAQLQWQDALACYQESLQVCRQIVDEFGETPESLRDLLVSHAKMAQALSGMDNHLLACEHALVALQLATALLENHPDDPQTQEDYRNAQILASEVCGSMPFGVR
jgi:tetratricopeptide (TPR) repeat protein